MMQWGLGMMGMSVDEFFDISFRQFTNKLKGFNDHIDNQARQQWESLRLHAATLVQSWTGKKVDPERMWELRWDEKAPEPTEEGLNEFKKKFGSKV